MKVETEGIYLKLTEVIGFKEFTSSIFIFKYIYCVVPQLKGESRIAKQFGKIEVGELFIRILIVTHKSLATLS